MKELGLFGITMPEEFGGNPLDVVSFALVFEEISRGWMGIAGILGSHSLACAMIARHGTDEQKHDVPPRAGHRGAADRHRADRTRRGHRPAGHPHDRAWRDGDHYVVTGTKTWITNARHADPLPVLVKTDPDADPRHRGMRILLVDAGSDRATRSRATSRSSATRARSPARSSSTTSGYRSIACSAASRAAACSRRCRAWSAAASTSPPAAWGSRSAPTTRRWPTPRSVTRSVSPSRSSRRSSSSWPHMATQRAGGAAHDLLGGDESRRRRPRRLETGMAKLFASDVALPARDRGDEGARRLRLLDRVRDRAPLPRRDRS